MSALIEQLRATLHSEGLAGVIQDVIRWGGLPALIAIVFAETGLLVGFFLPGDSLLVTAGILCTPYNPSGHPLLPHIALVSAAVAAAAIVGDTVGYWFGYKTGPLLFARENSLLFSRKHLARTQAFYERHGGKTVIIARFVPIIRTFAPVVAGIGRMSYRRFLAFNVFGGLFWVLSMLFLGFGLASAYPQITKQIDKLALVIILLSLLPGLIGWLRSRNRNAQVA